ncbi:MAG: hypothetical protein KDH94_00020 [Coxiellaceae bacterium]|nr:hypothetical protein [Coxiellaceae bacterium]
MRYFFGLVLLLLSFGVLANPILSEYWCGPDSGCGGQSQSFSDINPKATQVIVAFSLVNQNGVAQFQMAPGYAISSFITDIAALKKTGKKVLLSVGGQGADWTGALNNPNVFSKSIFNLMNAYGFDGVDLDIESSSLATQQQADQLIIVIQMLRSQFNQDNKQHLLITVSPESTTVVKTVPAIGGGWNAMVPVINKVIDDIDYIQVQAYNDNPLGDKPGTSQFLKNIYNDFAKPFSNGVVYKGMPSNKLILGVPASSAAANAQYYATSAVLDQALKDLKQQYGNQFGGVMLWDSHWDALNAYAISNAAAP